MVILADSILAEEYIHFLGLYQIIIFFYCWIVSMNYDN